MASLNFGTPACFFGARMSDALFSASPSHLYFHLHPALKKYIAHYTLSPPCVSGPAHLTLIPDAGGCLVFAFGISGLQAHFWGPTTHPVEVHNDFKHTPYRSGHISFSAYPSRMPSISVSRLPMQTLPCILLF